MSGGDLVEREWVHPTAGEEWWYVNGHLISDLGAKLSFMVCFFRQYLCLMIFDEQKDVCKVRILEGHSTRFDPMTRELRYGESTWSLETRTVGGPAHHLEVYAKDVVLRVNLYPTKPPLIVGLLPLGLLGRVNYYAIVDLECDGSIMIGEESVSVKGRAWIDRMWGTWEPAGFARWEWISMLLNDGTPAVLFAVFHPLRRAVPILTILASQLENGQKVTRGPVTIAHSKRWKSKESGIEYPLGWQISSEKDPRTCLVVEPKMDAQELHQYIWEGACSVSGTLDGRYVEGDAYAEIAYAVPQTKPTALGLALLFYAIIRYILRRISRQAAWALDRISLRVGKILGIL